VEEYQERQKENTDVGHLIENNDFGTMFKIRFDNHIKKQLKLKIK
jgi:hypothetical protein